MKLTYNYSIHGFSGGMMLTNTIPGEWDFDSFEVNQTLKNPNSEVIITVLEKSYDTVTINIVYRNLNQTLKITPSCEGLFKDEANAYGFSLTFNIKE
jgi:hypothetical protein